MAHETLQKGICISKQTDPQGAPYKEFKIN